MNSKLNKVTHGEQVGLDYIKIPKREWIYSRQMTELYQYNEGVFEAYPQVEGSENMFHKQHVLKVIPDDAVMTMVEEGGKGYKMTTIGGAMQWTVVDSREEMEKHLLQRNKHHLQQVAKEDGITMQQWFQSLIGKDGYSIEGDNILDGEINWREVPEYPEVKAWLKTLIKTDKEIKLPPIRGGITTEEYKQAFQRAKENTLSSPSGLDYTIWK